MNHFKWGCYAVFCDVMLCGWHCSKLNNSCHHDEVGGDAFLWNVGSYKSHMSSHPRRRHSSWSPQWIPQISHFCRIIQENWGTVSVASVSLQFLLPVKRNLGLCLKFVIRSGAVFRRRKYSTFWTFCFWLNILKCYISEASYVEFQVGVGRNYLPQVRLIPFAKC
jgi:hypothetical protein